MLISGIIAPRKTPYVQQYTKQVDLTSWKWAKPVSAIMITTLIYLYVLFSKIGIVTSQENIKSRFILTTAIYIIVSIISFIVVKVKFNKSFDKE